jgi:lysyl-tRNA synthetase class 2
MLEWYRAGESYEALMQDCATILRIAAEAVPAKTFAFRGRTADPSVEPERLTVAQAFEKFVGIDVLSTLSRPEGDREALARQAKKGGIRMAPDDTWSDIFSRIIVERVEPHLGIGRPTILYEYPAPEAALARPKAADPRVAERFELYVCGVEVANAFGELTDPDEQRRRFAASMALKEQRYGERYPVDEDFFVALAVMPESSGCALGFDRLVMLATGAERIEQVVWTPTPRDAMRDAPE